MTEQAVLVFAHRGRDLLLIHKLRGLGTGKINGPGGRLEPGESFADAGRREVLEETGMTVVDLEERASLVFRFTNGYQLDVRAFVARAVEGPLVPCDEADPFWCDRDDLPWNSMWADDPLWLPHVLAGRRVDGQFLFEDERMLNARLSVGGRSPSPNLG